ncbi:MFS transporter [Streptomyces coacervatus]|uniref:MFS transporter n=1 Tax=Streptomyces coacervatus TaxID=647381 RepID=UPI0031E69E33
MYALFGTAPLWLDSLGGIVARRWHTPTASDWRAPFQLYAVGLLLAPAMAAFLPRARQDAAVNEALTAGRRRSPARRLVGICVLSVFGGIVFYTVRVETAYLMNGLGVQSSGLIGMVTAIASAATVTGSAIFASMIGRPERRLTAIFALCGAGLVVIGLAQSMAVLIIGTFLNCVGTGFLLATLLTWAMSKLVHDNRGRGTGLWTASFFFGQFLCPIALVALEAITGSLATAVGILGLVSAVVAVGLLPFLRRTAAEREFPRV